MRREGRGEEEKEQVHRKEKTTERRTRKREIIGTRSRN